MTPQPITVDANDLAHLLTAFSDTRKGYPERELADGWRAAADRICQAMRAAGHDDDGAWAEFGSDR